MSEFKFVFVLFKVTVMQHRKGSKRGVEKKEKVAAEVDVGLEDDDNSTGFGNWIKSSDGTTYMSLFVLSNSFMLLLTMGWPQIKRSIEFIHEYFTS